MQDCSRVPASRTECKGEKSPQRTRILFSFLHPSDLLRGMKNVAPSGTASSSVIKPFLKGDAAFAQCSDILGFIWNPFHSFYRRPVHFVTYVFRLQYYYIYFAQICQYVLEKKAYSFSAYLAFVCAVCGGARGGTARCARPPFRIFNNISQ